jgi:hypothetical protein
MHFVFGDDAAPLAVLPMRVGVLESELDRALHEISAAVVKLSNLPGYVAASVTSARPGWRRVDTFVLRFGPGSDGETSWLALIHVALFAAATGDPPCMTWGSEERNPPERFMDQLMERLHATPRGRKTLMWIGAGHLQVPSGSVEARDAGRVARHGVYRLALAALARGGPESADAASSELPLEAAFFGDESVPAAGDGNEPPQLVKRVSPVYPPEARIAKVEGRVAFIALVDEKGRVRELRPLGGSPLLVPAAAEAACRWTYSPAKRAGAPIATQTLVTLDFERPVGAR